MWVGGHSHAPAALPRERPGTPLYRRLGGPQGRSGQVRKFLPPPGFDPQTVQRVSILTELSRPMVRYTYYTYICCLCILIVRPCILNVVHCSSVYS